MGEWTTYKELKDRPFPEGIALSVRQNVETKQWELVEIEFDLARNQFKANIIVCGETKSHAMQKYSIRSVQLRHNVP